MRGPITQMVPPTQIITEIIIETITEIITEFISEIIATWLKWLRPRLFVAPMEEGNLVELILSSSAPTVEHILSFLAHSEVVWFVVKLESYVYEFDLDDLSNEGLMLARMIAYEFASEEGFSDHPDDYGYAGDCVEYDW